jgi:hypothetical protein
VSRYAAAALALVAIVTALTIVYITARLLGLAPPLI